MNTWTNEELQTIGDAEEIDIVTLAADGQARPPVTIWVVRVGDALYVRSAHGRDGAWFQAAAARPEGQVLAGGATYGVTFVPESDPSTHDRIDAAYHAKYDPMWAQYVPPVANPESRAVTLRLLPAAD